MSEHIIDDELEAGPHFQTCTDCAVRNEPPWGHVIAYRDGIRVALCEPCFGDSRFVCRHCEGIIEVEDMPVDFDRSPAEAECIECAAKYDSIEAAELLAVTA